DINMDEVSKCLLNALEWLGAGAKTAGGYGQFIKKDHHPVKKSWEEKNQSLVEKFETMAEKELYENFSKNYSKNKKNYTEAQWKEIIETICITHESMIMQWGNTNDKKSNKYKAFKKISNDENTLL
ncbi:MAG: hypothetical protein KAG10_06045, partial [Methylococcales bacterium]|nr:hypothetical protein [Methylococcales bacterium]